MRVARILRMMMLATVFISAPSFAETPQGDYVPETAEEAELVAGEVPVGARERVIRQLEEWWKPVARETPATFGLDQMNVDVNSVRLGAPFVLHILQEEDFSAYVTSSEVDPTLFTGSRWYVFPLFADEVFIGSLSVCHNVDPDGGKLNEGDAEFTTAGASLQEDRMTREILALREQFPGFGVASVMARGSRFGRFCMLTDSTGQRYVVHENLERTPLRKAAPDLKNLDPGLFYPRH